VPFLIAQAPVQARTAFRSAVTNRIAGTNRIFDAPRAVALWHLVSLDAPTVAVVWSLAFAWAGGIHLSSRVVLVLALATSCAYVGDRLLDTQVLGARAGLELSMRPELRRPELRERHYFHWRNRRVFVPLAGAAACVAAIMALGFLPDVVRERGSVLAAAALAYFSGVHAAPWLERRRHSLPRLVSKEFLVAVLFTAGCILPAWSRMRQAGAREFSLTWFWIDGIYFVAVAWLNCRFIARWEREKSGLKAGEQRRYFWAFNIFPAHSTDFSAAVLLASAGLLLACVAFGSHSRASALLAAGALSALLLATLDSLRARMTPLALRAAADLVLLTPLLLFLR